ncbi:shikimate dehydrogenase [Thermostilla marina]
MICVSVARGRHRHMIAEYRHMAEQGAGLVELRIDYIRSSVNIKRLIQERPCPVIVSCRRERDGGRFSGTEEQRLLLLRTAIAEGVDYVDLEDDIAGQIPRFGPTKRIISHHDFRKTPDNLEEIHARMAAMDADIVKICTMANHPQDNFRMLELVSKANVPTVGFCMGDIGIPSRILCGKYGSPFTYATFHQERALAPGQLSFDQVKNVYRFDEINAETEVYGVIADPVGHSLSPLIHNAGFKQAGLNKVYLPMRIPREDVADFIDQAEKWDIKGLSVTIPHKEAVIPKLTKAEASVKGIGACNTIVFQDGQRLGYNTDCKAAIDSIQAALGRKGPDCLKGSKALVLGAGGAGKAVAFGLLQCGADVVVTDGDAEKARQLAERFRCRFVEWDDRYDVEPDLLANCTPIGMHPNVDETPFASDHLRTSMLVFDAVYNPENTLLIKEARARNCKVVTGVEMFVRQACLQFKLFTGREGPAQLMREVIKRATSAAKW